MKAVVKSNFKCFLCSLGTMKSKVPRARESDTAVPPLRYAGKPQKTVTMIVLKGLGKYHHDEVRQWQRFLH